MRGRPSALCALCWLCVAWPPAGRAQFGSHGKSLELFEFVLRNDVAWGPVLRQTVRLDALDGGVPYHRVDAATRAAVPVVDELRLWDGAAAAAEVQALPVLRTVVVQYRWLRSYAELASRVLAAAFTCFTYANLSMVVAMVLLLERKYEQERAQYADGIGRHRRDALLDVLGALVLLMDKMAAAHGCLDMLANVLYEYDESVHSARAEHIRVIGALKKAVDDVVGRKCAVPLQQDILENLGFDVMRGSLLNAETTAFHVKKAIDQVIERLLIAYDNLRIESIPLRNWNQILDYQVPVDKNINPYLINEEDLETNDAVFKILEQAKTRRGEQLSGPFQIGVLTEAEKKALDKSAAGADVPST